MPRMVTKVTPEDEKQIDCRVPACLESLHSPLRWSESLLAMLSIRAQRRLRYDSGQSLIETAIMVPLLLVVAFNAINFGYAFFVAINLAAAPRQGVEYSIQGFDTPAHPSLATATAVSTLTYGDLTTVLPNSASTPMQVCTMLNGFSRTGSTQVTKCTAYNNSGPAFPTPASDPEAPTFVLHRVDVRYTPQPLIPGGIFNVLPSFTYHRQVSMRAMN